MSIGYAHLVFEFYQFIFERQFGILLTGTQIGVNTVSAYLDASFVYGSSPEKMKELRALKGGQLLSNAMNRHKGMKDLLPPQMKNPDANCKRPSKDIHCFMAGNYNNNLIFMASIKTIV